MDITALTFDERDEFRRKSIAEKVISLLKADIDISPMVIDGSWGTGKTEFCHKLINLMHGSDTHHLIYIDAFKADHADEPLMTVLAEIIKVLPDDESKQGFMKKTLPAVRYGLKTIAKAGVSHLLRQDVADVADDFDKQIQSAADKAIDATVESVLKVHVKADKNLKALQAALAEIAVTKPIILFVDELDRCRPNFAVDMLEIIKHTFDVEGVNFVLITNTQQLKASVNHCYGHAVDAQRYLDKFIKFRFELSSLSDRHLNSPILAAKKHFFTLAQEKKCLPDDCLKNAVFGKAIEHLIQYHSLSLREVETLILHIQIAQTLSNSDRFVERQYIGYTLLRLIGVMLVCYRPELLIELKKGNIDATLLGEFLGVEDIPTLEQRGNRPDAFEVMMVILAKDCNKNVEKYIPQKEQEEEWDKYIHHGFMGDIPDSHEAINQIIETANIMAFE
ncbi:P-loop NTPase fold protein [Shewanella sp. 10N.286.48.A6]|uniref:KAP family P-loop NTPase fold protein n=1 Tax=Shewanella sp. 10N.286.48.A6 TaxID=1880833 RepID=UPI000C857184|nr:P-loop NTPase fold protein [Shewanella sp. 10N.286.48.A6]PMI02999.1 AAA family ATPase [Shewanella sp. 10N.286.48.A6]